MGDLKQYVPNALTLSRVPLAIGFLLAHIYGMPKTAIACAIAGCLTDYFDGYFARLWNVTSNFGKVADAYTDKAICWILTGVAINVFGFHPILIAAASIQVAYDGGLTVLRYILGQVNIPVNQYAKWKTTMLMSGFILLYFAWILDLAWLQNVAYAGLAVGIALAIASIATYLRGYKLGWLIPYPLSLIL